MDNNVSTANLSTRDEISDKIRSGELVFRERDSKSKSRLWDVFTKLEDRCGVEFPGYVSCLVCERIFRLLSSNLVKHKCYTNKFVHDESNSSVSIIEFETPKLETSSTCSELNLFENANDNLTELITKCLIKNCQSYALMQDDGLKAVFKELVTFGAKFGTNIDVEKLLPSSLAVARNVSEIHDQCLKRVKAEISKFTERGFGLAAAVWSDNFGKKSYLALTIHFLKNGSLTFRLLGLRSIDGLKYSSQNIYEKVEEILREFECKLSNESILLTNGDGTDSLKAFPKNQNLPCISLLLKNALNKSLEEVPEVAELTSNCLKFVNFFKNSELNSSLSLSLQSYSPNRWNTMYKMLITIENNWSEITTTLRYIKEEEQCINAININHLKAVTKTLQPFEEAIESLEEHNSPTLHLVLVYLHELKKSCNTNDSNLDLITNLKQKLLFYLDSIEKDNITIHHKLAIFLYPPTNKLLQFSAKEKKIIEGECIRLMKCFVNKTQAITCSPESKRQKLFADFVVTETNHDPNVLIKQELQFYKNTRAVNSADFDVFSWWELQKYVFPLLYKLSSNVFATPASSASVQRVCSAAGSLIREKLSKLDSNEGEIEKIMFVKFNAEQHEMDGEV